MLTKYSINFLGMVQINAHINLFNDICTSETVAEVEIVGQKLGEWLSEYQIISHLFGPNLHVEVIKQSQIVLNFLAVENQITEEHINLIWQAAQLKHCSKPVYDILPSLVKNLAPRPALHLYLLLCRLDPKEHTEQSIYITSALTKLIWSRDGIRQHAGDISSINVSHDVSGLASSSENSVSIDGSNSDDDQNEDSSEDRKSPIEIEACSDSGAPPCKQSRSKQCSEDSVGENSKKILDSSDIVDEGDTEKMKGVDETTVPIIDRLMVSVHEGSSSDENVDAGKFSNKRKKIRKRNRARSSLKKPNIRANIVETISDVESPSDSAVINDSDCSEGQMQASVLNHLHAEGPFIGALSDGYVSPFFNVQLIYFRLSTYES